MAITLEMANLADFEYIYNDMETQFPKNEMKPYGVFCGLLNLPCYDLYHIKENETSVGYALIANNEDFLWLEYFAIYKKFHSKGYGSKIIASLKDNFPKFKGCFLEVEKPDENKINTIRRIKFYENLGVINLNYDYFYPNEEGFIKMELFYLPFGNVILPDVSIIKKVIKKIFLTLHAKIPHLNEVLLKNGIEP